MDKLAALLASDPAFRKAKFKLEYIFDIWDWANYFSSSQLAARQIDDRRFQVFLALAKSDLRPGLWDPSWTRMTEALKKKGFYLDWIDLWRLSKAANKLKRDPLLEFFAGRHKKLPEGILVYDPPETARQSVDDEAEPAGHFSPGDNLANILAADSSLREGNRRAFLRVKSRARRFATTNLSDRIIDKKDFEFFVALVNSDLSLRILDPNGFLDVNKNRRKLREDLREKGFSWTRENIWILARTADILRDDPGLGEFFLNHVENSGKLTYAFPLREGGGSP
ncbi:MAG: hypothetical protein C5B49_08060 [Bdellovibrio sp.]|nr:MAG: hypothetical protein C5B49_08060 [Bdellovibrio sp.]